MRRMDRGLVMVFISLVLLELVCGLTQEPVIGYAPYDMYLGANDDDERLSQQVVVNVLFRKPSSDNRFEMVLVEGTMASEYKIIQLDGMYNVTDCNSRYCLWQISNCKCRNVLKLSLQNTTYESIGDNCNSHSSEFLNLHQLGSAFQLEFQHLPYMYTDFYFINMEGVRKKVSLERSVNGDFGSQVDFSIDFLYNKYLYFDQLYLQLTNATHFNLTAVEHERIYWSMDVGQFECIIEIATRECSVSEETPYVLFHQKGTFAYIQQIGVILFINTTNWYSFQDGCEFVKNYFVQSAELTNKVTFHPYISLDPQIWFGLKPPIISSRYPTEPTILPPKSNVNLFLLWLLVIVLIPPSIVVAVIGYYVYRLKKKLKESGLLLYDTQENIRALANQMIIDKESFEADPIF